MKCYVDRIEGNYAVLQAETGETARVSASEIPEGAVEGGVLEEKDGVFMLMPKEETARRKRLFAAQRALKRNKETE